MTAAMLIAAITLQIIRLLRTSASTSGTERGGLWVERVRCARSNAEMAGSGMQYFLFAEQSRIAAPNKTALDKIEIEEVNLLDKCNFWQ